jgi:predicted phage terminase large subunit-like protein
MATTEIRPQPGPQEKFLASSADVVFYGGSAGGGKTYALLLNPLYHVDNPKFGAVTFRRTTKQVRSEGGLWDTAEDLYSAIGAKPNQQDLHFTWPSGARHTFAHMEHEKNRLDWQGAQIPLIQFDELTHFTWKQFSYMLSRNRSVSGVPGRIRATLNPDPDHWARRFIDWWIGDDGYAIQERSGVVRYFAVVGDDVVWGASREELQEKHEGCLPKSFTFIRSRLEDNKILMDADPGYRANLEALPRVERAQLMDGNWNVRPSAGMYFLRSDFEIVDTAPPVAKWVRAWDQAGTKKEAGTDPDWSVGVLMGKTDDGRYVIRNVERFRENPSTVDRRIKNTAESDGRSVKIRLAQDPGQAGKSQASSQTRMLAGYQVSARRVTGDKETRAKPFASQVEAGNVMLVRGKWNEAFLNEHENFPEGAHDDQVDAASDAFDELSKRETKSRTSAVQGAY